MTDETPQKEVVFLDGFLLSIGMYEYPDGDSYIGLVMEDIDKKYFLPFIKQPSPEASVAFRKAFRKFDRKYSNIGSRE